MAGSASAAGGRPNPRSVPKPYSFLNKKASGSGSFASYGGLSSALILKFPPNFVRQLSTKARRNCSNIGVAQVVAASWANSPVNDETPFSSSAATAAAAVVMPDAASEEEVAVAVAGSGDGEVVDGVQGRISPVGGLDSVFSSDASLLVHAGKVMDPRSWIKKRSFSF